MTELLRRLHRLVGERLATRTARVIATIAVLAVAGGIGWPMLSVADSLQSQRAAIVRALDKSSAKDRDPAAMQLLQRGTVSAGDREYGGPRLVPRPVDLFDEEGRIAPETKNDLAWRLLWDQVPAWMPAILVRSPVLLVAALVAGTAAALAVVWLGFMLPALEVGGLYVALAALAWWLGWPFLTRWMACAALSFLVFAFLWRAARAALSPRRGPFAVASNTSLEGVRSLAAPGFALPVAMLLPLLALSHEPGDQLLQAIPGFLDWGHTATYTFAALFVIFFGCATSSFEIRDRQVWSVVTKPISPGGWLVGKWLGTFALGLSIALGGTLLLGAGTAYLASLRPLDERDARDVRSAVLVGRIGFQPVFEQIAPDRMREIIDQEISGDSVLKADIANGKADEADSRRSIATAKAKEFRDQQRRIGPGDSRPFTFLGLGPAAAQRRVISLRYRLHGGGDDEHRKFPAMIQYETGTGAGMWELRDWVPGETYTMPIDPKFVDANGTLRIRIFAAGWDEQKNQPQPLPVTIFVEDDSLEVMVDESTFVGNLASALAVDGAKLAFLAAMSVAAGAILSFPIAVLVSFGVFAMATLTPFLSVSIRYYYPDEKSGFLVWAFQEAILLISVTIEFLLGGFAARSPSDALAQGRAITWESLGTAVLGIGLGWTLLVLAIGWFSVRRKEIAVYSGQG